MHSTYTTISGDTWDMIAYKTTGNELYKNDIMKKNMAYREIVVFPAGILMHIPEIKPKISDSLPPWKKGKGNE